MLSIIIPAYNEGKYIDATLKSIKNQSFKDYEFIVVCNGCTDNTQKIAKKYTSKVFNLKNKNVSYARNYGALKAGGEKLIFLDADIQLTADTLSSINSTNSFGTCYAIPSNRTIKNMVFVYLKNKTNYFSKFIPNLCGSNGIIFIKKDLFRKLNGFNEKLKKGEDKDLMIKAKRDTDYVIVKSNVILSTRRYDKIGWLNIISYWLKEFLFPSNKEYEAIR